MVNIKTTANDLYLVEPDSALRTDNRRLVARALWQGSEYVPLRLMNVTGSIATQSPVCEVKRHCIRSAKQENVPEHLKDLYERTAVGIMAKEQKVEIAKLQKKYSDTLHLVAALSNLRFNFSPDLCIKSHLITAQIKQNFEIKTVAVPRCNQTISLKVQNAIVKFTREEFSFFRFYWLLAGWLFWV